MRLKQRNSQREKVAEYPLQARFIRKYGKENAKRGKILLMMRSHARTQWITLIRSRKAWATSILGRKLTWRRCSDTNIKDLATMLKTVEERRKHKWKVAMKCSMHTLKIMIQMMCYSWPTLNRTQSKPTCGTWIQDAVTTWLVIKISSPS